MSNTVTLPCLGIVSMARRPKQTAKTKQLPPPPTRVGFGQFGNVSRAVELAASSTRVLLSLHRQKSSPILLTLSSTRAWRVRMGGVSTSRRTHNVHIFVPWRQTCLTNCMGLARRSSILKLVGVARTPSSLFMVLILRN